MVTNLGRGDRDAAASERHLALGRSGSAGPAIRIALPTRTSQVFPILFHHRSQNLLAGVDAEIAKRSLDLRKGPRSGSGMCRVIVSGRSASWR